MLCLVEVIQQIDGRDYRTVVARNLLRSDAEEVAANLRKQGHPIVFIIAYYAGPFTTADAW